MLISERSESGNTCRSLSINYPQSCSRNALTQPIKNHTLKRKSKFNQEKQAIETAIESIKVADPPLQAKPSVYANIQTIRKVATFLQKIQVRVVRERAKLEPIEYFYLQNDQVDEEPEENLIRWEDPCLMAFELIHLGLLFFTIWLTTYEVVLGRLFDEDYSFVAIAIVFYVLSIALFLNTELKTEKLEIIEKRSLIWKNYLWNDLPFEAISIFALLIRLLHVEVLFYPERILLLLSVNTAFRIMKKIEDSYAISTAVESMMGISKLVLKILCFLHILSLLLIAISQIESSNGINNTWVDENGLTGSSPFELYIHGYYWGSTILSTVGFGDITPGNVIERGIMSFVEIFCCLFFGYCVNYIGNTIGLLGESRQIYEKDIRRLNKYLKTINIPDKIKAKAKEHFYNKNQIEQVYDAESEEYLFKKMTQDLRSEIKQKGNSIIIENSKYLRLFTEETRVKIANRMAKKVYAPGEILFDQETGEIKLFLIQEGDVSEFCFDTGATTKKPIAKYNNADNTIGWSNLVTGYKYRSLTKAENYTLAYQISQDDFIKIVKENNKDFIKFQQVRERILQREITFKKDCFVCTRLTHNVVECPKIHYIPRSLPLVITFLNKRLRELFNRRNYYFNRSVVPKMFIIDTEFWEEQEDEMTVNSSHESVDYDLLKQIKGKLCKSKDQGLKRASISISGVEGQGYPRRNDHYANRKSGQRASLVRDMLISHHQAQRPPGRSGIMNIRGTVIIKENVYNKRKQTESCDSYDEQCHQSLHQMTLKNSERKQSFVYDAVMFDEDENFFPKFNISEILRILREKESKEQVEIVPKKKKRRDNMTNKSMLNSNLLRRLKRKDTNEQKD